MPRPPLTPLSLCAIAAPLLALVVAAAPACAEETRPITRADVADRLRRVEAALFPSADLPPADTLDAVDQVYNRIQSAWFMGRRREACEGLARAHAVALGETYGEEFAVAAALAVDVEPKVAELAEEVRIRAQLLYKPEGVKPDRVVEVTIEGFARSGCLAAHMGPWVARRRIADLSLRGVEIVLPRQANYQVAFAYEHMRLRARAALLPRGAEPDAAGAAIFEGDGPRALVPDGFPSATGAMYVFQDFGGRLGKARTALAALPATPLTAAHRASIDWAFARLASGRGGPVSPAFDPEGPVLFHEELARLEELLGLLAAGTDPRTVTKERGMSPGGPVGHPPVKLGGLTVQAFRDPRGKLVPYTLYVPPQAAARAALGEPVPLVLALHGVTANEFMFHEAYGGGRIRALADRYGLAVACPRLGDEGMGFRRGESASADEAPMACIEAVARLLPLDRARLFLLGHSMGGMIGSETLALRPGVFRSAALVAGAANGVSKDALRGTSLLVAWGTRDPIAFGSRLFAKDLEGKHPALETLELTGAGHLMSVALSLDRAFALFGRTGSATSTPAERVVGPF